MGPGSWFLVGIAVLVLAIVLEGRRQERRYGRGRGARLMRTGLLELQKHLEPERKVERMLEERGENEASRSGDPPRPGAGSATGS